MVELSPTQRESFRNASPALKIQMMRRVREAERREKEIRGKLEPGVTEALTQPGEPITEPGGFERGGPIGPLSGLSSEEPLGRDQSGARPSPDLTAPASPTSIEEMSAISRGNLAELQELRPDLTGPQLQVLMTGKESFAKRKLSVALPLATGVTGGLLGAPAGAVAAGVTSTVGFAAGEEMVLTLDKLEAKLRGFKGRQLTAVEAAKLSALRQLSTMRRDAPLVLGLTGIGLGANLVLKSMGKFAGVLSPGVADAMLDARNAGMADSLSAVNLALRGPDIAGKALLAIPVLGGVARKESGRRLIQVGKRSEEVLSAIAPAIDLARLSKNMSEAALKTWKARRTVAFTHYAVLYRSLKVAGNPRAIPTKAVRERAQDLLGRRGSLPKTKPEFKEAGGIPIQTGGEQAAGGFAPELGSQLVTELQKLVKLTDHITATEFRAVQRSLNRAMRRVSKNTAKSEDFGAMMSMSKAMRSDLDNISTEFLGAQATFIKEQIKRANKAWFNYRALEETAAAYPMVQHSPNFFKAGLGNKVNKKEMDTLADTYLESLQIKRSKDFVEGLDELFGVENRQALARAVVSRAFTRTPMVIKSEAKGALSAADKKLLFPKGGGKAKIVMGRTEVQMLDAKKALRELGLDTADDVARKVNTESLETLLKGTDVTPKMLRAFLKTAERIQASPGGDPAAMLTRRIVLGGSAAPKAIRNIFSGSAEGATALGAAAGAGVTLPLVQLGALIITVRQFSKLITTAKGLRLLQEGMKTGATATPTAAVAFARRFDQVMEDESERETPADEAAVKVLDFGARVFDNGMKAFEYLNEQLPDLTEALGKTLPQNLLDAATISEAQ